MHDNNGIGVYYKPNRSGPEPYKRHCLLLDGEVSIYNNAFNGKTMNLYLMSNSWPINVGDNFRIPANKKIGFTYVTES